MTSEFKKITQLTLAAALGAGAFVFMTVQASAQSGTVTFCYQGRTLVAPPAIFARYQAAGATMGACPMTP